MIRPTTSSTHTATLFPFTARFRSSHARAVLDTADARCVEIVVPLQRLGISMGDGSELAFNVKINGVMIPGSGSSPSMMRRGYGGYRGYGYGYPYGYGQQGPSKPREEPGVWVKAPLAKE